MSLMIRIPWTLEANGDVDELGNLPDATEVMDTTEEAYLEVLSFTKAIHTC